MSVAAEIIMETYPELVQHLDGDVKTVAEAPSSQIHPTLNSIVFVAEEKFLDSLFNSEASILVVHEKISGQAKEKNNGRKTLLVSKNTYLAMALVNARFFPLPFIKSPFGEIRIHPTAVVAKTARLGKNVVLGPYAVISENVIIGDGSFIGAHSVIETNSTIGRDCFIHPQVYIGHSCQLGNRVEVKPHSTIGSDGYGYAHDEKNNHYRLPHYGVVVIEDDVHIGANVNIDRGTFDPVHISAGTKIDNHCHFGHNVQIGKNCLITAGMITAGSVKIGDNCVFGGRTSINGQVDVVSNSTIAALSGVNNDVTQPGIYGGYPLTDFRESLRINASLMQVPRLRRNLAKVMKHLGLADEEKGK